MKSKRNPIAKSLASPHLRQRVIPNKKRCAKLTKEQKKAVWNTPSEQNLGLGFGDSGLSRVARKGHDPKIDLEIEVE